MCDHMYSRIVIVPTDHGSQAQLTFSSLCSFIKSHTGCAFLVALTSLLFLLPLQAAALPTSIRAPPLCFVSDFVVSDACFALYLGAPYLSLICGHMKGQGGPRKEPYHHT